VDDEDVTRAGNAALITGDGPAVDRGGGDGPRRRGRPMSAERSDEIIRQAGELLQEVGFDRLRMQDVAERAGVGLATIYRRWPTKRELANAALGCVQLPFDLPVTDDPKADVRAVLHGWAEFLAQRDPQGTLGILSCALDDSDIGTAWRMATTMKLDLYLRERLGAVLGADHPEIELRAQAGPAIVFYKALIVRKGYDPKKIDAIVDAICRS
jgi:AcrR family transcriptional regulator